MRKIFVTLLVLVALTSFVFAQGANETREITDTIRVGATPDPHGVLLNLVVDDLAESAVVIGARAWVRNEEFWPTKWRILEEIKLKLDENGIAIPYPQVTVHMQEKK